MRRTGSWGGQRRRQKVEISKVAQTCTSSMPSKIVWSAYYDRNPHSLVAIRQLRTPPSIRKSDHSQPSTESEDIQAVPDRRTGKGRGDGAERPHRNPISILPNAPASGRPPLHPTNAVGIFFLFSPLFSLTHYTSYVFKYRRDRQATAIVPYGQSTPPAGDQLHLTYQCRVSRTSPFYTSTASKPP